LCLNVPSKRQLTEAGGRQSSEEYVESPFLTGLGLAAPAGLNAWVPLLVLALSDRLTDKVNLTQPYDFLSSTGVIILLLVLLGIEIVVDKIPGFDHANDLIQSVFRPAAGAILLMATTNDRGVINPVIAMVLGLAVAGAVHAVKTISRPAITLSTGGLGNPIVSMIEDGVAILASILAIVLPVLAIFLFVLMAIFVYWSYKAVRHLVRRSSSTQLGATKLRQ
jgi:hypothetical protein